MLTESREMNPADVIHAFADAGDELPRDAMQWALDHWDAAAPAFITLLERYATGSDRTLETEDALFFALHLLGEKRETRAFPSLCRLLLDGALSESVLGDAITEHLRQILISTYNGDRQSLEAVVEATTADEFARSSALEALAYLARTGAFPESGMRDYLLRLFAEMQPQDGCYVWVAWAMAAANLGYQDLADKVEALISRGLISDSVLIMRDFERQVRRTLADATRMAGFDYDRFGPFDDAIGSLARWHSFTAKYPEDSVDPEAEALTEYAAGLPYTNVLRNVGRNDPCPCGSGRKYKKCCLA